MAKEDKITPSQRLLDLIRKPSGAGAVAQSVPTPAPQVPVAAATERAVEDPAAVVPEVAAEIATVAGAAAATEIAAEAVGAPPFEVPDEVLAELPAEIEVEIPTDIAAKLPAEPVLDAPTELVFEVPTAAAADAPAELVLGGPTELVLDAPADLVFEVPTAAAADVPTELVLDAPTELVLEVPTAAATDAPAELVLNGPTELVLDAPADPAAALFVEPAPEVPAGHAADAPTERADEVSIEGAAEAPTEPAAEVPTKLAAKAPAAIAASVAASVAAKVVAKAAGRAAARTAGPRRSLFSLGKKSHVGVDISQSELVCVKILGRDAGFEVLATEVTPIPAGVEPGSQAFIDLLGRALKAVCGPGPIPSIWAATQSARANLQFLTIPKVASRQVDNAVFWTAKKEMGFDEAGVVFDFERRGEVAEKGATRLGAMAYTTPRDAVAVIRNDFAKAGFPLAGLTLEPFAHQNLFRRRILTEGATGAVANLHVGQHWSRLEIFSNGNLMFVRVIKTSMSGMEQAVLESLESRGAVSPGASTAPAGRGVPPVQAPAGPPEEMVLDLDSLGPHDTGLILELDTVPAAPEVAPEPQPAAPARPVMAVAPDHARELVEAVIYGCMPEDECHPGSGLTVEDVMEMLRPVASRLVRQVEMTIKHYRESLGHEPVSRLTVSGVLGGSALFIDFIRDHIGLPCTPLDILSGRRLPPGIALGRTLPSTLFTQALGLALSDNAATPSVFVTYKDRAAIHLSRLLEQWSLVGLAAVLAGMALFFFAAVSERQGLERERDALSTQLAAFGSGLDASAMSHKAQELRGKVEAMRRYVSRNHIVGAWEEALALAPEGVRLGTLTAECGPVEKPANPAKPAGQSAPGGKDPNSPVSRLVVEGVVTGDSRLFDSMLASYVVALEGSPLFEDVSVKRNELENLESGATALRFVVTLNFSEVRP